MTPTASNAARLVGALRTRMQRGTAILTGALLLALTGVTLIDVLGRYFFSHPLSGASELTELLVMAVVFAGLPAICLDDGHITVDLFTSHLAGRASTVQIMATRLVVAMVLAVVAWQLWLHGTRLGSYGETTIYLRIPLEPVAKIAAVISAVSSFFVSVMAVSRAPLGRPEDF